MLWNKAFTAQHTGVQISSLAIGPNGEIGFHGTFGGNVDFGTAGIADIHTSAEGNNFISVFHADGSYGWTRVYTDPYTSDFPALSFDPSGEVIVAGTFSGTAIFGAWEKTDVVSHTAIGRNNVYVLRLSAQGDLRNLLTIGQGSDSELSAAAVVVDFNSSIFVGGYFLGGVVDPNGTADFDPTTGVDLHAGRSVGFITRINFDGSYGGTKIMGGASNQVTALRIDEHDNLFACGTFRGTVDFDPGNEVDLHTAQDLDAPFVTKFNSDGSYAWTRTLDGLRFQSSNPAIAIAPDGGVFLAGYFSGFRDFDPSPEGEDWRASPGDTSAFLTRFSKDGDYLGTQVFGGANGQATAMAVVTRNDGSVTLGGHFTGTVDFDPGNGTYELSGTSATDQRIFVTSLDADGSHQWTRPLDDECISLAAGNDLVVIAGYFLYHAIPVDLDPGCATSPQDATAGGGRFFIEALGCVLANADTDANGIVDTGDLPKMLDCFTGPGPITCHPGCYSLDFDSDDDIDLADYAKFELALTNSP